MGSGVLFCVYMLFGLIQTVVFYLGVVVLYFMVRVLGGFLR